MGAKIGAALESINAKEKLGLLSPIEAIEQRGAAAVKQLEAEKAAQQALLDIANKRSEKFWRAVNELPFLAAIIMVIAVTTEFGAR